MVCGEAHGALRHTLCVTGHQVFLADKGVTAMGREALMDYLTHGGTHASEEARKAAQTHCSDFQVRPPDSIPRRNSSQLWYSHAVSFTTNMDKPPTGGNARLTACCPPPPPFPPHPSSAFSTWRQTGCGASSPTASPRSTE